MGSRPPRFAVPQPVDTPLVVPEMMRAAVLDEPGGSLRLGEVPTPSPVMTEVLVRVVAAGINPIDDKTRSGRGLSSAIAEYPAVLGFDFSGVVARAPYETAPFPVGTPVYGMAAFPRTGGSFAEYVTVPLLSIARSPVPLSHVEAAGVPLAALTAWGLIVETARAHEGQQILIHAGAGGVGHFAVQLASYFGAHVTATASEHNAAWLRELGADVVVDYRTERFEEVVGPFDVVIDLIGNASDHTGSRSLEVLRPGGLIVVVPTGSWPGYEHEAAAAGVRATSFKVSPDGAALATISRLLESGAVQAYTDSVYDLAEAQAAFTHLAEGHTRGKIVLRVSDD